MAKFTGKNRQAAKFLGVAPETFKDPGFCLGCGEVECECPSPSVARDPRNSANRNREGRPRKEKPFAAP